MNVEITSRHAKVPKQIKDHVEDRVEQALRHQDGVTSVHAVLDSEKGRHRAELIVHGRGLDATVHAESADMWAAIDACAEKLRHKLEHAAGRKREKRRRTDGLSKLDAEMAARASLEAARSADELPPAKVIRVRARSLEVLAVPEARAALHESDAEHLVFRDDKHERVHVLYRRRDGQLGLIDTGVE